MSRIWRPRAISRSLAEEALALARRFWPGPLTLVLPRAYSPRHRISELVTAGLDTVAIRVPAHAIARALLAEAGVPIAAPSANRSGRVSPTRAGHVADDFGAAIGMILDGGDADAGLEFEHRRACAAANAAAPRRDRARRHRGGAKRRLAAAPADKVQAPGQLLSHYAPNAALRLDAELALPGEAILGFGPLAPQGALNLSPSGDLREAAANLFAFMRALDAKRPLSIAVMPIPDAGLGEAINDRLRRAAAPRQ